MMVRPSLDAPDQGSHGCPRDSFISSGYSVSLFVLSFPVPA